MSPSISISETYMHMSSSITAAAELRCMDILLMNYSLQCNMQCLPTMQGDAVQYNAINCDIQLAMQCMSAMQSLKYIFMH